MKFAMGIDLEQNEAREWRAVLNLVEQFLHADAYLFTIPMWNFGIPYELKQYIDLITHPGLTFTRDENGPKGLARCCNAHLFPRWRLQSKKRRT